MKPVIIASEALSELADAVSFYESRQPGLGLVFETAAREIVTTIQSEPKRFPLQKNGTSKFVMLRFPFVVHFMEQANEIWILAFAHTSRKPNYWHRRL